MDAFKIFVTEMMKPFKLPGQIVNEAMPELYEDDSYKFIYIFGPHLKPIVFFSILGLLFSVMVRLMIELLR